MDSPTFRSGMIFFYTVLIIVISFLSSEVLCVLK
uniref:Uncharacterized protein n=1 Tax=Arundo donax TaxID=35708 RepID=A0A0A9C381_ARUDO